AEETAARQESFSVSYLLVISVPGWGSNLGQYIQCMSFPGKFPPAASRMRSVTALFAAGVQHGLLALLVVGGGATTYLAASTTHLHRHLRLSHRHLAAVLLLRDLGPVLTGVVLSQLGGRGHRPRWVAAGQLLAALATFATLATVFTHPPPPSPAVATWWEVNKQSFCDVERLVALASTTTVTTFQLSSNSDTNNTSSSSSFSLHTATPQPASASCHPAHNLVVMVWLLASILNGVGSSVIFTIGIPYLDDAINKHDSPLYLGMGVGEQGWVGAWWIGQLGFALVMLTLGCVLLTYPRTLGKATTDTQHRPRSRMTTTTDIDVTVAEMVSTSVVPCDPPPHTTHTHYPPPAPSNNNDEAPEVTDEEYSIEEIDPVGGYAMDERDSGYSMEELENGDVSDERLSHCVVEEGSTHTQHRTLDQDVPNNTDVKSKEIIFGLKEVWSTLVRLLRNKVVVYTVCSDFFLVLATSAVVVWLPKYIHHQFRVTQTNSSFYTGICGTSSAIVGVGVGGVWVRRCRPRAKTLALVMAACMALQAACLLPLTFVSCGFDDDHPGVLTPDLRCGSAAAKVSEGYCRHTCPSFMLYNVVTCITKSLLPAVVIGSLLITLRCVAMQDKPAVLGIKSTVMSLAAMTSPFVVDTIMDSSCLMWEVACGAQTSCSLYNTTDFRYKFHGLACVVFVLSTFFTLLVSKQVKHLELLEETHYNLPSFSFFDGGTRNSPTIRRSFRKMSRLAAGRRSSGKWKVPTMNHTHTGDDGRDRELTQQEKGVRDEGSVRDEGRSMRDEEVQNVEPVIMYSILPSMVMKTTGV
ncbi:Solute carrier organic anion transporter family member 74D-like 1, partial [Homarus americanus]